MKQLEFIFPSKAAQNVHEILCGVVGSGNLEVLATAHQTAEECRFTVRTSVVGFDEVWQAVLSEFATRYQVGGIQFEMNDMGATPAVVTLRLGQAVGLMEGKR